MFALLVLLGKSGRISKNTDDPVQNIIGEMVAYFILPFF
jgi:hypothetical protein